MSRVYQNLRDVSIEVREGTEWDGISIELTIRYRFYLAEDTENQRRLMRDYLGYSGDPEKDHLFHSGALQQFRDKDYLYANVVKFHEHRDSIGHLPPLVTCQIVDSRVVG